MARPGSNSWIDRKISAPTLLIWGEQDFALGKELTYGMEGLFTGPFEIKYIADSGHWVQNEKPELVNQYVRDFLDSAQVAPASAGSAKRRRFPVPESDFTPLRAALILISGSKRLGRRLSHGSRSKSRMVVCIGASRQTQKEGLLCPLNCM